MRKEAAHAYCLVLPVSAPPSSPRPFRRSTPRVYRVQQVASRLQDALRPPPRAAACPSAATRPLASPPTHASSLTTKIATSYARTSTHTQTIMAETTPQQIPVGSKVKTATGTMRRRGADSKQQHAKRRDSLRRDRSPDRSGIDDSVSVHTKSCTLSHRCKLSHLAVLPCSSLCVVQVTSASTPPPRWASTTRTMTAG